MHTETKSEDTQALRNLIPLTTLSTPLFAELCSVVRIENAPNGTVLFRQGDDKNEFVYLLAGKISLQAGNLEMDVIEGGSEASRFALAHQIPRKVDAVAKTNIRFVRIDSSIINKPSEEKKGTSSYQVNDIPEESSDDWMTALLKSPIFERLPASNLQKLIMDLEEIEVDKGTRVVNQGDPGDYYYILKEGQCLISRKPNPNAKEVQLAKLKACDTFGEDALIADSPRNVSVTMLTPGSVLRIGKDSFLKLIKDPVIKYIDNSSIQKQLESGAVLVDVRSPDDYEKYHLEQSKNMPFFSLRMQMNYFEAKQKSMLICEDGKTSEAAAFLLIRHGFDAEVVRGGIATFPRAIADQLKSEPKPALAETANTVEPSPPPEVDREDSDEIFEDPIVTAQTECIVESLKQELSITKNDPATPEQDTTSITQDQRSDQSLEKQLAQMESVLKSKTEALEKIVLANTGLKKLQADSDRKIMDLQKLLKKSESNLSQFQKAIQVLQHNFDQAGDVKKCLTQEIQTLNKQAENLTQENAELKAVVQGFVDQKQYIETNEEISSLKKELETVQNQANNDFDAMTAQLNAAKKQAIDLKEALEEEKQKSGRLTSELSQPLAVSANHTPPCDHLFSTEEEEVNQEVLADEGKKANHSIFQRSLLILLLATITIVSAAALIFGTESGKDLLRGYLDEEVPTQETNSVQNSLPARHEIESSTTDQQPTGFVEALLTPEYTSESPLFFTEESEMSPETTELIDASESPATFE